MWLLSSALNWIEFPLKATVFVLFPSSKQKTDLFHTGNWNIIFCRILMKSLTFSVVTRTSLIGTSMGNFMKQDLFSCTCMCLTVNQVPTAHVIENLWSYISCRVENLLDMKILINVIPKLLSELSIKIFELSFSEASKVFKDVMCFGF